MKREITVQERLKDLRVEQKLTLGELAEQTGISKSTLGQYEAEDFKDITHRNLAILANFYHVSTDYLLGLTNHRTMSNVQLHELRLNDEVVTMLKNGSINNRLLCEIMTHPQFRRFLLDAEIYVDGSTTVQFRNLNQYMEHRRQELLEHYHADADSLEVRTIESNRIEESCFLLHHMNQSLAAIMRDVQEQHKNDFESHFSNNPTQELVEATHYQAENQSNKVTHLAEQLMEASDDVYQLNLLVLCHQLQVDPTSIPKESADAIIRLFKASPQLKQQAKLRRGHGKELGR